MTHTALTSMHIVGQVHRDRRERASLDLRIDGWGCGEVHVNQPPIGLHYSVLQPACDVQLNLLYVQYYLGKVCVTQQ